MTVRLMTGADVPRWDAHAMASSRAACYHLAGWKNVIEHSFGHETYYLLSESPRGEIDGLLPLVYLSSWLFGSFLVSLPFFNYGGICADSPAVGEQLLSEAVAIAGRLHASHIELRQTEAMKNGLAAKTHKVCMILPLPGNPDELWQSFPAKLRSQVRRPQREGMRAEVGGEEELDGFYEVFSRNMRDLGTPVYPKSFFRNILRQFPDAARIVTVYAGRARPVASGFLVGFKGRLEIPWASSLREFNHLSPNMLLYWRALQFGCEQGYGQFDFGRSTPGEGTYRFKAQWGAEPLQLHWHYWVRGGKPLPELNPKNPRYRTAIAIWTRLPVALTRLIGPPLVKNLP